MTFLFKCLRWAQCPCRLGVCHAVALKADSLQSLSFQMSPTHWPPCLTWAEDRRLQKVALCSPLGIDAVEWRRVQRAKCSNYVRSSGYSYSAFSMPKSKLNRPAASTRTKCLESLHSILSWVLRKFFCISAGHPFYMVLGGGSRVISWPSQLAAASKHNVYWGHLVR